MLSKRFLSVLLAAIMCLVPLLACAEQAEPTAEPSAEPTATEVPTPLDVALGGRVVSDEPTHITVGNSTKVNGSFFTYQFGNNTSDIDVRVMIHGYSPVVWDTQLTFVLDPQVVLSCDKSTDSDGDTVYTISLAEDLTWNDGTPITAADYVFGYYLKGSPEFEELTGDTDVWSHIKGYEDLRDGVNDYFSGIRLLGDYRFSVTVKQEYLPYFYEYAYLSSAPVPISVIAPGCEVADDGKGVYIRNIDETIEEPIYTADLLRTTILDPDTGYQSHPTLTCGPYSLTSYDAESGTVEFELNPYFKGNYEGVKPVINYVTLVPVLPQNMREALESGEVDLINKVVDGDTVLELRDLMSDTEAERSTDMSNYARMGYGYIALACEQGPQQFVKVRQAIDYAFDNEDYVRSFLKGFGITVNGFYGIAQWMYQVAVGNLRPETLTTEQEAIWDTFTLDNLNPYSYDIDKSLELLIEDGWTLNEKGEAYDPEVDTVRYKKLDDGSLMRLSFKYGLCEDNNTALDVLTRLKTALEPLGVEFVVETVPYAELLRDHQRENGEARKYDMMFMAYNFKSEFDPWKEFTGEPEEAGTQNSPFLYDEELEEYAWQMHTTEPGDITSFEQYWLKFQTRYNEILPTIPLYGNVYFDFYSDWLHNYNIEEEPDWPRAILYAYWSEPEEEPEATAEPTAEPGAEGEIEIEDEDDSGDEIIID